MKSICSEVDDSLLNKLSNDLDVLETMRIDIQANLNDGQPLYERWRRIREGIDKKLDDLRDAAAVGHQWFKDLEIRERARLDILLSKSDITGKSVGISKSQNTSWKGPRGLE